ncbi:MAG: hypothetical protein IPG56_02985 [Caulobacteraceae bacterium]|nr:hypothetical protein [Caulobacteraceae bacterium]
MDEAGIAYIHEAAWHAKPGREAARKGDTPTMTRTQAVSQANRTGETADLAGPHHAGA